MRYHRLLRRQIKKAELSEEQVASLAVIFKSVNDAYYEFDKDLRHIENVLELSSQELYKANQKLLEDVEEKTQERDDANFRLDRIVNTISDIIFQTDTEGNYVFLNKAWERYTGIPIEKAIGQNYSSFIQFVHKDDLEKVQAIRNIQFAEINELKDSFRFITSDGELKWLEFNVRAVFNKEGVYDGTIGTYIDITELVNAGEAKNDFLSTMSHEIRTPLNAVVGISNILLMEDHLPEQLDNLNALKFSSNHLLGLINDILDFNKIESGKIEFDQSDFSLKHLFEGIKNTLGFIAQDKGLHFKVSFDSDVPNVVQGDSTRLNQVITNLVNNAIKFTDKGKVRVDVELLEETETHSIIRFSVEDMGIGISEDKIELIFESFTQAEKSTTKKFGGTGLGLAISKRLLQLQGSDLRVSSVLSEGSTFWFDLALKKSDRFDAPAPSYVKMQASFTAIHGLNVLVAEDNKMNVLVLRQFFKKWEVNMTVAENGIKAIEKLKEGNFDIILMDLQMPEMDGYTATEEIRKFNSNIPIVALTASALMDVKEKTEKVGMNEYLSKPFNPVDLYNVLKHYHNKKELS